MVIVDTLIFRWVGSEVLETELFLEAKISVKGGACLPSLSLLYILQPSTKSDPHL